MPFRFQQFAVVFCMALAPASVARASEAFYGTQTGKVFHNNSDCPSGKKILEENRVKFASASEAEAQGRRLCRTCERLAKKAPPGKQPPTAQSPPAPTSQPTTKKIATSKPSIDPAHLAKIKAILPGGTLVLDSGEKARLLGICMPQADQPCCDDAVAWFETQHRAKKCISAWDDSQKQPARDEFGRLLMYLSPAGTDTDLSAAFLTQGLAWVDWDHHCDRQTQYTDLEYQAWVANRGIWKRLDGAAGMEKVEAGRHARQYHPINCAHHAHLIEPVTITINEAKARRLVPCENYHVPTAKARPSRDKKD